MSSKNCGQSSRENIMQRTRSKGEENKASLRTTSLQSPTTKRPLSTSSRPEGGTPEAARTKAQRQTHIHASQSESVISVCDFSHDTNQELEPSDPLSL